MPSRAQLGLMAASPPPLDRLHRDWAPGRGQRPDPNEPGGTIEIRTVTEAPRSEPSPERRRVGERTPSSGRH
jgi:hypothetical protein